MKDIIGYTEMAAQATDSVLLKMCQLRLPAEREVCYSHFPKATLQYKVSVP